MPDPKKKKPVVVTVAPTVRMKPVVVTKPADPDDDAIGAYMNDVRSGDPAGAMQRFQDYQRKNVGRGFPSLAAALQNKGK